jgi:ligand-binding sensor domain-containing protein
LPGDLTSSFYGPDRAGGIVVAAERTPADRNTLWAATSFGRLFVSKNADAAGAAVRFTRIDTTITPNRFVTRIVVDRANPNVALISYSGFNALTPATPGHVFRAIYDPVTGQAAFEQLDFDLGDLPINTMAYDDVRGDLYVGTDFGPLVLRNGAATWELAGVGFPEALMVDLEIVPERRVLVAATHGLGIFYLTLR